jgi:hypothetical protein
MPSQLLTSLPFSSTLSPPSPFFHLYFSFSLFIQTHIHTTPTFPRPVYILSVGLWVLGVFLVYSSFLGFGIARWVWCIEHSFWSKHAFLYLLAKMAENVTWNRRRTDNRQFTWLHQLQIATVGIAGLFFAFVFGSRGSFIFIFILRSLFVVMYPSSGGHFVLRISLCSISMLRLLF